MNPVIEVRDLTQSYKPNTPVLDALDLTVGAGQVIGLLGRNGAGKTTLLRSLIGLMAAQSGSVRVFGLDPFENGVEVKRRCGFVAEDQTLPAYLKVRQVLDLHRELFPTWDDSFASELGGRFGLDPHKRISDLSMGQARQVAVLCAIAHRPELLLLDEPAGGLDPAARREFLETAIEMLGDAGSTVVFSSHYMADVERIANRVVVIDDGKVWLDDELDTMREEFVLAQIAGVDDDTALGLTSAENCIRMRRRESMVHGVFRGAPRAVQSQIEGAAGGSAQVDCRRVPLEDLFVEIFGGSR